MALADTAKLVVDLSLKGNFTRGISKATAGLDQLDRKASRGFQIGQQIGTGIQRGALLAATGVGLLAFQVGKGLESLVELEKQTAQTNAVIKSTKGVAQVSAAEVGRLAEKYESINATIGDEFIRSAQNMILTFTNIRGKAFEPTLEAILNMNTALGRGPEGLQSTAIAVGKALNDPAVGLTALRRVGVSFSKAQIKRIKALQDEGKLYEAQKVILAELNKEFGGSFLAGGGTTAGKVAKFHDAIEDLQRTLAAGMLPVVSNIADALSDLFRDPALQKGVEDFGRDIAAFFTPARIKEGIAGIKNLAAVIGPAFRSAAGAIGLVVDAFSKLPPDLRNLLVGAFAVNKLTGGLVTNIAGGLAGAIGGALKTIVAGNVTVIGKSVVGPGGVPTGGVGGAAKTATGAAAIGLGPIVAAAVAAALAHSESSSAFAEALRSEGIPNKLDQFNIDLVGGFGRLVETLRVTQRILAGPPKPAASPDRQEAAATARLQKIADTFVAARAERRGEIGRGPAPGPSTNTLQGIKELAGKLTPLSSNTGTVIPGAINSLAASSKASIATLGSNVASQGAQTRATTTSGALRVAATTQASSFTNAAIVAGTQRAAAASIVAAIWAARPVVNVTNVTKTVNNHARYGPSTGSSGANMPGQSGV